MAEDMRKRVVVGLTGASGAIYGVRVLEAVVQHFDEVYLCISQKGALVLQTEMRLSADGLCERAASAPDAQARIVRLDPNDMFTPPASGSFRHSGMVIAPCSMGTAGRLAAGASDDLISRAGDVCLKERRPLVLIVRETPLSLIHLRNLTGLAEAGATIMPASPSFYHAPATIEALVDTVVTRALAHLGVPDGGAREWQVDAP
jgi:4-hydroxy-3-polyprenylbenzoate decarboxylase